MQGRLELRAVRGVRRGTLALPDAVVVGKGQTGLYLLEIFE